MRGTSPNDPTLSLDGFKVPLVASTVFDREHRMNALQITSRRGVAWREHIILMVDKKYKRQVSSDFHRVIDAYSALQLASVVLFQCRGPMC